MVQASSPAARSVIRKNVPDIMLQNPASTVAIMTNSKRRRSIFARRREHQERHRCERLRRHALPEQSEPRRAMHQHLVSAGQGAGQCEADAQGEQGIQRIRRHRWHFRYTGDAHCFAKSADRRYIILKKGLTAERGTAARAWLASAAIRAKSCGNSVSLAYSGLIRPNSWVLRS